LGQSTYTKAASQQAAQNPAGHGQHAALMKDCHGVSPEEFKGSQGRYKRTLHKALQAHFIWSVES
jgi:hypothetical protein